MQKATLILPVMALVLFLAGCGSGGSATPEGAANDVLSAVQSERYERIYRNYLPTNATALQVNQEREKFRSETTENWWENNRERISGTGDNSLDPGKKLKIEKEEDYHNLSPDVRAALWGQWYRNAHRWERFEDRIKDLRLVSIEEQHGLEGDGSASVSYRNRYGDSLSVRLTRFRGSWFVTGVSLEGEDKLPTRSGSSS